MTSRSLCRIPLLCLGLCLPGCDVAPREQVPGDESTLDPPAEQLRLLRRHPGFATEPFVMMNLLKFKDETGRDIYFREYASPALRLVRERGGEVVWAGAVQQAFVGSGPDEWDYLVLVRWPSRKAFLDMVESPAYGDLAGARGRGLNRTFMLVLAEPSSPPKKAGEEL